MYVILVLFNFINYSVFSYLFLSIGEGVRVSVTSDWREIKIDNDDEFLSVASGPDQTSAKSSPSGHLGN